MEEFHKIIKDLTVLFQELTAIETIKLKAGRDNQISAIEECMTKEQSLSLRLKGLDKIREQKQEELGYGGMRFQDILDKVSEDQRAMLLPLFDTLSREIQMFQQVSEDTSRLLEINSRQLQKLIQEQEGLIYNNSGGEPVKENHMTDRSV